MAPTRNSDLSGISGGSLRRKQAAQRARPGQEPRQHGRRNHQTCTRTRHRHPSLLESELHQRPHTSAICFSNIQDWSLGFSMGYGRACARFGDMSPGSKRCCQGKLRLNAAADLSQKLVVWQRTNRFAHFGGTVQGGGIYRVRWREAHALIREAMPSTARRRPCATASEA